MWPGWYYCDSSHVNVYSSKLTWKEGPAMETREGGGGGGGGGGLLTSNMTEG